MRCVPIIRPSLYCLIRENRPISRTVKLTLRGQAVWVPCYSGPYARMLVFGPKAARYKALQTSVNNKEWGRVPRPLGRNPVLPLPKGCMSFCIVVCQYYMCLCARVHQHLRVLLPVTLNPYIR